MKNIKKAIAIIIFIQLVQYNNAFAQINDNSIISGEYIDMEDALKNPEKVIKLNLSNKTFKIPSDTIWSKFINLEYLSLKDDHLKEIPSGIGNLKNLKTLDLSGNDFKILPKTFSNLSNLGELFLNDEKKIDFNKSIFVIKDLPNLKIIHLENDNLSKIPKNLFLLNNLESLYINNNNFRSVPLEPKKIKKLKFIDLHDNKHKLVNQAFGIKIQF